ncbi:MAG TPA: EamA family transporter [Nitriliruptorales bacterium]|nr:EamA family transporter [Nitriliruptorales bacterium]
MTTLGILLTSIVLATVGQLLLKAGMTHVGELGGVVADAGLLGLLARVASTWQVVAGLGAFGLSAIFWLVTLSRLPLSTAYPVVSLSYVLILAFSVVVLGERPSGLVWAGVILITFGITLVGVGQR